MLKKHIKVWEEIWETCQKPVEAATPDYFTDDVLFEKTKGLNNLYLEVCQKTCGLTERIIMEELSVKITRHIIGNEFFVEQSIDKLLKKL